MVVELIPTILINDNFLALDNILVFLSLAFVCRSLLLGFQLFIALLISQLPKSQKQSDFASASTS